MNRTPGPWTKLVYPSDSGRSPVVITDMPDGNGLFIAEVPNPADATLIAAAPDMLALLRRANEKIHLLVEQTGGIYHSGENAGWLQADIEKIIAKATAAPVAKDTDNG